MKETFHKHPFRPKTLKLLEDVDKILTEYESRDYHLTLRQLYYQLVSKDIIPNNVNEYKKIGTMLTNARYSGMVDWEIIEDRLRKPRRPYFYESAKQALEDTKKSFIMDRHANQEVYVEVWVEKDAISNILYEITSKYGIRLMVNRGYSSTTAMYDAYKRFNLQMYYAKPVTILYIGDHDPSGLNMVEDIEKRIWHMLENGDGLPMTCEQFEVTPIAITKDQIKKYNPPKNPAKIEDSRSEKYIEQHGESCWEVDALNPEVLEEIVTTNIESVIDLDLFKKIKQKEAKQRNKLSKFIDKL